MLSRKMCQLKCNIILNYIQLNHRKPFANNCKQYVARFGFKTQDSKTVLGSRDMENSLEMQSTSYKVRVTGCSWLNLMFTSFSCKPYRHITWSQYSFAEFVDIFYLINSISSFASTQMYIWIIWNRFYLILYILPNPMQPWDQLITSSCLHDSSRFVCVWRPLEAWEYQI